MISCDDPLEQIFSARKNYTIASTFEKAKSLKFELLFGQYKAQTSHGYRGLGVSNAVDYHFAPGQIFGFHLKSFALDFKTFRYAFVMKACAPGEEGSVVRGIVPGAQVLVRAVGRPASERLIKVLRKLEDGGVELAGISEERYRHLNYLLDTRVSEEYLVGQMLYEVQVG